MVRRLATPITTRLYLDLPVGALVQDVLVPHALVGVSAGTASILTYRVQKHVLEQLQTHKKKQETQKKSKQNRKIELEQNRDQHCFKSLCFPRQCKQSKHDSWTVK